MIDSSWEQQIDEARQRPLLDNWARDHESELLRIGHSMLTPDFALRHRRDGSVIHVVVAGIWTPECLADKRLWLQRFPEYPHHAKQRWQLILGE